MKMNIFKTFLVCGAALCSTALAAQDVPAVLVSDVVEVSETNLRQYIGRLDAINDATIPARVSGELVKCNFKEGDFVQKDAILFELDDAVYRAAYESAEAQVKQAEAQIKQANANKKYATDEFARAEKLKDVDARKAHDAATRDLALAEAQFAAAEAQIASANAAKATAEGNLNAAEAAFEAAKSTLAAAKAALKSAEINLSYTKIKAPFSGKIG